MRDSAVWNTPAGASLSGRAWAKATSTCERYIRTYVERCPGRAVSLELIMHRQRTFDYHDPEFWAAYRTTPAWEFARFLTRAEQGEPRPDVDASLAETVDDVDVSLKWMGKVLARCESPGS